MSGDDVEASDDANGALFRDVLFNNIIEKSAPASKPKKARVNKTKKSTTGASTNYDQSNEDNTPPVNTTEMVDFCDYLATEIFESLPKDLQSISHENLKEDQDLSDKWSLPLSLSTYEEIAELVSPSVSDTLQSYGLIDPPKSDLQSFLSPIVATYLAQATAPPIAWAATKTEACEMCERWWVPLTYHHLIPREVHEKVLKRGWHEEKMLQSVAWLCRACHSFVHRMASNEELAREYYTIDRICAREDVEKFAKWMGTVRWKKR